MKTVPLATFNELEPAQELQRRLQAAGIPATIHDESKVERFWFMSEPFAAVHVGVDQPRYLEARRLLAVWETNDGYLPDAVCCPECHSSRVEYPQLTRKFASPTFLRLFMAAGILSKEFYCLDCHYTWPTVMKLPPKLDMLGFRADSKFFHPGEQQPAPRSH
ncbi:MAG: hypothetical protein EPO07_19075 [Verrucomicrobia bacterium]|nr:MAG: hypothetical protein EPO07_19075 [Verrucomicrobiota bacterium]